MIRRLWPAVVIAAAMLTWWAQDIPSAPAAATQPSGSREDGAVQVQVPVVHLRGTAQEMGQQHAGQLEQPIHLLIDQYLTPFFSSSLQRFFALTAASGFEPYLLPEHRDELTALSESLKIERRQLLLGQCFLDLSPMMACSTVSVSASASRDGVARLARNLDFPSLGIADRQSVLFIYRPQGKYAFAAVGWPGMMGVLSGMNEHGLALANMEVSRGRRLASAMPYTLLYRSLLENCRTVEEAIARLERTPRQSANNLMLMDAAGDRAVVEITPEAIHVRRARGEGPLVSTNHQRGDDETTPGMCRRYDALYGGAGGGSVDVAALRRLLAEAAQGKSTMQSMIFEPTTGVLYLATGANAPRQQFRRYELRKLLSE